MTDPGRAAAVVSEPLPGALDGERVDRAVALICDVTRREAAELVDRGAVTLNGRPVTSRSHKVRSGQVLGVDLPERPAEVGLVADPSVAFDVVYQDPHLVVVNKPAGLVVHPGAGRQQATLVHGLLARYPELADLIATDDQPERPGIVHRLDKGTSGLLVVARQLEVRRALTAALQAHTVQRGYLTLVAGRVEHDHGVIDAPLGRSSRDPTKIAVEAGGRQARTHYEVQARYDHPGPATLLRCRLETGRTHQIRVHLAAIDHPVIGDDRYGGARSRTLGSERLLPPERPFLHAADLAFTHPVTGEELRFRAPLPPDLVAALAGLQ